MAADTTPRGPSPASGSGEPGSRKNLGPYEILGELGRGGMGVVYKAFHPGLKRTVALKVMIAGEDASEDAIRRFHREAEAVAKLGHHPNIVPVYDVGMETRPGGSAVHYIAMHFVDGMPLDRMLDQSSFAPRRAARIARKVAGALKHAHEHGVIHRDIKPANILMARVTIKASAGNPSTVGSSGSEHPVPGPGKAPGTGSTVEMEDWEPQVTDFGLAKDVESTSRFTASGTTLGTPQYMPPEQADGRVSQIDARSDVYSLGATLYEMLTGEPAFDGATVVNVIRKVLLEDPVPPRRRNAVVPRDLETICLKCLEKDPERRYQGAAQLEEDLRRYLEDEPIAARPASYRYRAAKRVKRNPALYAVGAAALALVVSGLSFFLVLKPWLDWRAETSADRAALAAAMDRKTGPERDAEALMSAAKAAFASGRWAECADLGNRVDERFSGLQGKAFLGIPEIRHRKLLSENEFLPLRAPYAFPLAEAAALRARALASAGDAEGARGAWARAYWRARQGRRRSGVAEPAGASAGEAPENMAGSELVEVATILAASLLALGEDALARKESRRARGMFEECLSRFPEPRGGPGTLGLARALQAQGDLEGAVRAYRSALDSATLGKDEAEAVRDRVRFLEHKSIVRTRSLPVRPGMLAAGVAGGATLGIDLNRDRRDELLLVGSDASLAAISFQGDSPSVLFEQGDAFDAQSQPDEGPIVSSSAGGIVSARGDADGDGFPELALARHLGNRGGMDLGLFKWTGSGFARIAATRLARESTESAQLGSGDVDGDGRDEFVHLTYTTAGENLVVYKLVDGSLVKLASHSATNFVYGFAIDDDPGRGNVFLISDGPYSLFKMTLASCQPPSPALVVAGDQPGFRSCARWVSALKSGPGFCFVVAPEAEAGLNWRELIENMGGDRSKCLDPGIFTLTPCQPAGWEPRRELAFSDSERSCGELLNWVESDRERFLCPVSNLATGAYTVVLGPAGGDWISVPLPAPVDYDRWNLLELDGDPYPELANVRRNGVCVTFGFGEPVPPEPVAARQTARGAEIASDSGLAICQTLAEMGLFKEAAAAFDEMARNAQTAEIRGEALLGRADALLRARDTRAAATAYQDALALTSARTRAVAGASHCLERLSEWPELVAFLEQEISRGGLNEETEVRMKDLLAKTRPLASMNNRVVFVDKGVIHPSLRSMDPLACSSRAGGLRLCSDASRSVCSWVPLTYGGESFLIDGEILVDRLDWASYVGVNLSPLVEKPGPGQTVPVIEGAHLGTSAAMAGCDTGASTSFPNLGVSAFFGGNRGAGAIAQRFPPAFPASLRLLLEYSRENRRWRMVIHGDADRPLLERSGELEFTLPPGPHALVVYAGQWNPAVNNPGWHPFRCDLVVRNLSMRTSWDGTCVPSGLPLSAAGLLTMASGAMVAGKLDTALSLFDKAIDSPPGPGHLELPSWPSTSARARVFRGICRLRAGNEALAREDVRRALEMEPAQVMYLLMRDLPFLDPEERGLLASCVVDLAYESDPRWLVALLEDLVRRGFLPAEKGKELLSDLKAECACADHSCRQAPLASAILYSWDAREFAHQVLAGQSLEAEVRNIRLDGLAASARELMDAWTMRGYDDYRGDHPADARGLADFASFLLGVHCRKLRDPGRALLLAQEAVGISRKSGDQGQLAAHLVTLGRARFASKDLAGAIATLEEALRLCPGDQAALREEMEKGLAAYRAEAAKADGRQG